MDYVRSTPETQIGAIMMPSINAFTPLLEKNKDKILGVPHKTYSYGPTERSKIDVWYPPKSDKKHPMLLFVYGGGFDTGQRSYPAPNELGYGNVASYFAQRGILTAIADYRLVPNTRWPGQMDDVRDALNWFVSNVPEGDPSNLFLMGHSAGANIISSIYLHPTIGPSAPKARGLICNAGAFHFLGTPYIRPGVLEHLYGDKAAIDRDAPPGLLRVASKETIDQLPAFLMLSPEKDPPPLKECHRDFVAQLKERGVKDVVDEEIPEHNHISVHWALGAEGGEGEEWGERSADWIKSHVQ